MKKILYNLLFWRFLKVLVVGDSHAYVFKNKFLRNEDVYIKWNVVSVPGATLSGLSNPNSKTRAMPIFREAIQKGHHDAIVFQIGEVDLGFVIHYRAERDNLNVQELAGKALDNYVALIIEAQSKSRVIVISTCLPTIDNNSRCEVANARSSIKADQHERTRLTIWFNKELSKRCLELGVTYIDLDPYVLGDDGVVSSFYKSKDPMDHHYNQDRFSELLRLKLLPLIYSRR